MLVLIISAGASSVSRRLITKTSLQFQQASTTILAASKFQLVQRKNNIIFALNK